jgi:hypothetical protein
LLVEIASDIPLFRVDEWVRYGRSCASDTRVALCVPSELRDKGPIELKESSYAYLRQCGVGLYRASTTQIVEMIPPIDLGLNVQLPELRRLPKGARKALGPAYEKFSRGDWREGFEEASLAVEEKARAYLKEGIKSTRIVIVGYKGRIATPTVKQVDKMTLGMLAKMFANIQHQNHHDALLAAVLPQLNPDRIGVVHKKGTAAAERSLRKNVGRLMWTAIQALRALNQ